MATIKATSKVYKNVRSYFSAGHGVENYNLVSVRQKLTETYIYRVMARHKTTGKYAVWTCWNETTQSLNFGHYNLSLEDAMNILYCKGEWGLLINQLRMAEIAEVLTSRISEYDPDFAREVLIDELDMEDEELDYFGISKVDLGIEEDDEDL